MIDRLSLLRAIPVSRWFDRDTVENRLPEPPTVLRSTLGQIRRTETPPFRGRDRLTFLVPHPSLNVDSSFIDASRQLSMEVTRSTGGRTDIRREQTRGYDSVRGGSRTTECEPSRNAMMMMSVSNTNPFRTILGLPKSGTENHRRTPSRSLTLPLPAVLSNTARMFQNQGQPPAVSRSAVDDSNRSRFVRGKKPRVLSGGIDENGVHSVPLVSIKENTVRSRRRRLLYRWRNAEERSIGGRNRFTDQFGRRPKQTLEPKNKETVRPVSYGSIPEGSDHNVSPPLRTRQRGSRSANESFSAVGLMENGSDPLTLTLSESERPDEEIKNHETTPISPNSSSNTDGSTPLGSDRLPPESMKLIDSDPAFDQLVDRVHDELERKSRIERERRGL